MTCELNTAGEGVYSLAGELCIFHAAELKPQLLDLLAPDSTCEIDLAQIAEVDTAGIQLLLLVKREAPRRSCSLSFTNHSDAMIEAITLLNLTRDFGDPLLIPSNRQEGAWS